MADLDDEVRALSAILEAQLGARALDPAVTVHPTRLERPKGGALPKREPLATPVLDLPLIDAKDLELTGVLGEGGMGVVHRAMQRSLDREVAVKRLHEGELDSSENTRALLDEAKHTGALEHPNIVPVYALGRDAEGQPSMVMKKVDGVRWSELIKDSAHTLWDDVRSDRIDHHVRLVIQLCRALEFAHSRGVLHRDIKPDNVLVGAFGEVVLLDWGLAVKLAEVADQPEGVCAGTPSYMAPEMVSRERGELGPATDVYLLGASLHHAITGSPPHRGENVYAMFYSVISKPAPTYGDEMPKELAAICSRTMEPDPKARFRDVAALRRALEDYLEHKASVELADAAKEQLDAMFEELEGERDALRVRERFDAARFGLEQALRIWPESVVARDRLIEAMTSMVGYHLEERNVDEARALLARFDALGAPTDLGEALAALELELADEREEQRRLKKLDADLDPEVSARQRKLALRALSAFAVVAGGVLISGYFFSVTPPLWLFASVTLALVVVSGGALFVFRRHFLRNRINRMMSAVTATLIAGVFFQRVHGVLAGETVNRIVSGDGILAGAITGLGAMVLGDRRLLVPAVVLTALGLFGAAFEDLSLIGLGVGTVFSVLYVTLTKRPESTEGRARSRRARRR